MVKAYSKYKEPKIVKAKRGWFIALFYEYPDQPGKYKRFEISGGVNYIKCPIKREKELEKLRRGLIDILKKGFDPFFEKEEQHFEKQVEIVEEEITSSTYTLDIGYQKYFANCEERGLSSESLKKYNSNINSILEWVEENNYQNKLIKDYSEEDILHFLRSSNEKKKWSARTYNNYIDFLSNTFATLEKMERKECGNNINYKIDFTEIQKKKERPEKNKAFVGRIAQMVKDRLSGFPELNRYVKWIYFTCMRPAEIRNLQIKHIDLTNRHIHVGALSGKTGARIVPISNELYELIKEFNIDDFSHDDYLFSKSGTPGEEQITKKHFSELFRRNIREPLGLSNIYTAYGWKHTRVVDLLNSGFTDYEVMSLTGHKNFESFEKYKRDLVIDLSKMKGKTSSF